MTECIRVLIADDHPIVRRGLRTLLGSEPDMALVGEASDGQQLVELASRVEHDVILVDLVMPGQDGISAIDEIKRREEGARILVLTSFAEDDKLFPAIKAGALGYVLKDSSPEGLLQAIRDVHQGRLSLHPTIALKVIRELNRPSPLPRSAQPLTEREVEVLKGIAQGLSNLEIAELLGIKERTVTTHVSNILGKLYLANRTQAALYAIREGLSTPPTP